MDFIQSNAPISVLELATTRRGSPTAGLAQVAHFIRFYRFGPYWLFGALVLYLQFLTQPLTDTNVSTP